MKFLVFVLVVISQPVMAANPVWLENKTAETYQIDVYRSATCGCCKGWIQHLKDHNFDVNDVVVNDVSSLKEQYNVPSQARSCHTAVVNGVVVEGHVPAQDIKQALVAQNKPRLLTVPAMPSGTPGMDTPGAPKQPFKVYSIDQANQVGVFNHYTDY